MRYWPFNIRANLLLSRKDFSDIVGIKPWRLLEIERGSAIHAKELTQILNGLGEVAFHDFDPKIKLFLPKMIEGKRDD